MAGASRAGGRTHERRIGTAPADELAPVRPALSRRRELSATSARSLLMTLLGEYVLPRRQPAWTATLIGALGRFGIEEKSARQALARIAAEGWLRSERSGRRVRWSLTEHGRRLLTEGAERIYSFGRHPRRWDEQWLVLLVSVPESKRDLRHRLRTQLSWAGFGSPSAGMWVCPDVNRQAEAHTILSGLGLASSALSFVASYGSIGRQESLVEAAWDLAAISLRYQEFVDAFADVEPEAGDRVLLAQTRLVHEWRRFPLLDPQLPAALLPADWTGATAAELFHRKHQQWHDAAQRRWDEIADAPEQS